MTAGAPSHFELGVPDARCARSFYGELFGWSFTTTQGENGWIETPGVPGGLHGDDPETGIELYFRVPDLDAALQRIRELGGEADEPMPATEAGRYARCRDDQGIRFGLHQPP